MENIALPPILILIFIIFISGIMGGCVNFLMTHFSKRFNRYEFIKSLLFGIFFSAIVLFFIEATTSNLIHNGQQPAINYIVFGCLCFLSTIFLSIILNQVRVKFPKTRKPRK